MLGRREAAAGHVGRVGGPARGRQVRPQSTIGRHRAAIMGNNPMTTSTEQSLLFSPFVLDGLRLRNRVVRSGCFEGLSQNGVVTQRLIEHHRRVAAGGVGMTTLSYCSVSEDGRAFSHEQWMKPAVLEGLTRSRRWCTPRGGASSVGTLRVLCRSSVIGRRAPGASPKFCLFRLSYCCEMTEADIGRFQDFIRAARWPARPD